MIQVYPQLQELQCHRCGAIILNEELFLKMHVEVNHGGGIVAFYPLEPVSTGLCQVYADLRNAGGSDVLAR